MDDKNDHWHVGRRDARNGEPRYKFQDPHLQKLYDEGYNSYDGDPLVGGEIFEIRSNGFKPCRGCNRQIPNGPSNYCGRCRI